MMILEVAMNVYGKVPVSNIFITYHSPHLLLFQFTLNLQPENRHSPVLPPAMFIKTEIFEDVGGDFDILDGMCLIMSSPLLMLSIPGHY